MFIACQQIKLSALLFGINWTINRINLLPIDWCQWFCDTRVPIVNLIFVNCKRFKNQSVLIANVSYSLFLKSYYRIAVSPAHKIVVLFGFHAGQCAMSDGADIYIDKFFLALTFGWDFRCMFWRYVWWHATSPPLKSFYSRRLLIVTNLSAKWQIDSSNSVSLYDFTLPHMSRGMKPERRPTSLRLIIR